MENDTKAHSKTCKNWQTKMRWPHNNQWNPVCPGHRMQVERGARKVWLQINCPSALADMAARRNLEEDSFQCNQISTQAKQDQPAKDISWFHDSSCQKRGQLVEYDGFKKITGTKIHVAAEQNGLPISIVIGPANQHDSKKFAYIIESISDHLDTKKIKSVYADKGYDSKTIRKYLQDRNIIDCIPKRNLKTKTIHHTNYNKTRYVVERFFAWLKNGFHRIRIRCERYAENYLAFVNIASIAMYWRVLGWVDSVFYYYED